MSDEVRVYRMEVLVVDHDRIGPDGARSALENARYSNRCVSPRVVVLDERSVDWSDDHPLSLRDDWRAAYDALFAVPTVPVSLVAHAVRNALVPARFQLSQARSVASVGDMRKRGEAALRGVTTALEFVDGLVAGAAKRPTNPVTSTLAGLAEALVQIVDQVVRGRHGPTLVQLLKAASALREASSEVGEDLREHIRQVDETLAKAANSNAPAEGGQ